MSTLEIPMPEMTYREAIAQGLREEMRRDENVFLIGEDIGVYGGAYAVTKGLYEEFGEKRVRDTPIAESVVVGAAIGAAMAGLSPIVELMTINFSLLAMDQIVNNAAKMYSMSGGQIKVPLVIRVPSGGGIRLGAQHSQSLEAWYAHVPGLKVVVPATPYDAKGMLHSSVRDNNPVIFVEHVLLYSTQGDVPQGAYTVPLGVASVKREGSDVTLVSYSRMVLVALAAAQRLSEMGIEAEVVDLRSLRPLDLDAVVGSVQKTGRVVVIEEAWKAAGFAGEVCGLIVERAFDYLDAPIGWVAGAEAPMPYARNLELAAIPDENSVIEAVKALF
jgi:pyruvate dehydrogenase E1 component beta subunit